MNGKNKMLCIYDNKNLFPKDKKYIDDVEAWFTNPRENTKEITDILHDIEKGSYCNDMVFTDRFNNQLYWEFLSTGAKAAILAVSRNDYIVNFVEAGSNVLECMINHSLPGNIYVYDISSIIALPCYDIAIKIGYDGEIFHSIRQLSTWRRYGHR